MIKKLLQTFFAASAHFEALTAAQNVLLGKPVTVSSINDGFAVHINDGNHDWLNNFIRLNDGFDWASIEMGSGTTVGTIHYTTVEDKFTSGELSARVSVGDNPDVTLKP